MMAGMAETIVVLLIINKFLVNLCVRRYFHYILSHTRYDLQENNTEFKIRFHFLYNVSLKHFILTGIRRDATITARMSPCRVPAIVRT
jgi:hypothetical protein